RDELGDASPEIAPASHPGEPSVQLRFGRRILCIRLDGEATVANAGLERRTRSGNIVTEAKLDRIIVQFKPRDGAGKPFDPDGLERGQRRILGEATGRFHRYPKPLGKDVTNTGWTTEFS